MSETHIEWTSPAPLWWQGFEPGDPTARRAFRTPAILRFATDSFMDELHSLMKADPARLPEFVALPETWSAPPGEPERAKPLSGLALKLQQARTAAVRRLEARQGKLPALPAGPAQRPLKLYQPAHQRFYMVSACLVCRTVGLPDRVVDTTKQEKVEFVVRLLQPRTAGAINPDPNDCAEFAFVGGAWQPVVNTEALLDGEDTNPLSPLTYTELDNRTRRLFTGLVPVGRREAYLAASQPQPSTDPSPAVPLTSPRQMAFKSKVTVPWSALEQVAVAANSSTAPPPSGSGATQAQINDLASSRNTALDQILGMSWYVFLDFANYLADNLANVWNGTPRTSAETALYQKLATTRDFATNMTLLAAIRNAKQQEQTLEGLKTPYPVSKVGWPAANLIFPLADLTANGVRKLSPALTRDTIEALVVAALPAEAKPTLPVPLVAQAPVNPMTSPWFTIRCVLERPNCPGIADPVVSEPSAAFQMSAFFDPDAPARPIRIGLPVDTSPAGLRKFDRNTAFIMSDTLCGQVKRAGSMSLGDLVLSVLPFPFHQSLPSGGGAPCKSGSDPMGMVCSFSIPIITICALIILIIIVKLLDIIFFWMPFFQICLPLPKFDAKGNS